MPQHTAGCINAVKRASCHARHGWAATLHPADGASASISGLLFSSPVSLETEVLGPTKTAPRPTKATSATRNALLRPMDTAFPLGSHATTCAWCRCWGCPTVRPGPDRMAGPEIEITPSAEAICHSAEQIPPGSHLPKTTPPLLSRRTTLHAEISQHQRTQLVR